MYFSKKNILIYYFNNTFYVIGLVRMPPIGLPAELLPVFTSPADNLEELTKSIESAYLNSDIGFPLNQDNLMRKGWDGEGGKVWNKSEKCWNIFWEEDNGVSISTSKPSGKYKGSMQYETISGSEKKLPPPVSSKDIAGEILNQLEVKNEVPGLV